MEKLSVLDEIRSIRVFSSDAVDLFLQDVNLSRLVFYSPSGKALNGALCRQAFLEKLQSVDFQTMDSGQACFLISRFETVLFHLE